MISGKCEHYSIVVYTLGKAKAADVTIGIENVWNRFLLSPLETRRFLDEIGSDYVGMYLDVGNAVYIGYPEQWIEILGHRIKSYICLTIALIRQASALS